MTCIVAIEKDNKVIMGGDRLGSNGHTGAPVSESKMFIKGHVTIGYCGSFRMGQLLQHALDLPLISESTDLDKWVAVDFMKAIRKAYADNGWDKQKDGEAHGGSFLLAVMGRCYEIQSDYSYIRNISGEYAIGSGQDYALGSLRSTRGRMTTHKRILESLETAAEYVVSVSAPFDIIDASKRGK